MSFNGLAPSKLLPEIVILSPTLYPVPPVYTAILSYVLKFLLIVNVAFVPVLAIFAPETAS